MSIYQFKPDKLEVDWKYIPCLPIIFHNCQTNEKSKLSQICKHYRNQLTNLLFSKLKLFKNDKIFPKKEVEQGLSRKQQFKLVINLLKEDLKHKQLLVKEVTFFSAYPNSFTKPFYQLFPNINTVKLVNLNTEMNFSSLFNTLKYCIKLKKLNLIGNVNFSLNFGKLANDIEISKIRTSIKRLERFYTDTINNSPFLENDPIPYYLTRVNITHPKMLNTLNCYLPSLTNLEFSKLYIYEFTNVYNLIRNNPQLTSLSLPYAYLNQNSLNLILSFKCLEYFKITYAFHETPAQELNLISNSSIRHINLTCKINFSILNPLLKSLINLKTLEVSGYRWYSLNLDFLNFNNFIDRIELNNKYRLGSSLDDLIPTSCFKEIIYRKVCRNDWYTIVGFDGFKNWKVESVSYDEKEYLLVHK
jgi:hypothetical protein